MRHRAGYLNKNLDNQDKECFNVVFLKMKVNVPKLQVETNKARISAVLCCAILAREKLPSRVCLQQVPHSPNPSLALTLILYFLPPSNNRDNHFQYLNS